MTVLSRGARARRGGRRPGWLLLTVLLVLAIAASSALVFTNKVELLKLAVILALWAAVVAAFVSVIYRRQSDVDQARARDLKLVYDLQLDREISARREYELTVESHLRRELASELRAQAADEVAALRAELAALRTNLEILFDADLGHRPALETDRAAMHTYGDWTHDTGIISPDRVSSSRITPVRSDDSTTRTAESPIIDVPEEPLVAQQPPGSSGDDADAYRGSHRRPSENGEWPPQQRREPRPEPREPRRETREPRRETREQPRERREALRPEPQPVVHVAGPAPVASMPPEPRPEPHPQPTPEPRPQPAPQPAERRPDWAPAPAPPAPAAQNGAAPAPAADQTSPAPVSPPPAEPSRGRHWTPPEPAPAAEPAPQLGVPPLPPRQRSRHSVEAEGYGGAAAGPVTAPAPPPPPTPRHRGTEEVDDASGAHTGGQSVADLLARLQAGATGGGRRRRGD